MNELLQEHGCSNVFSTPEGLKELMADISREVLRDQPPNIFDYIANYLSVLLITREHGILAVKILDDLCDCRPSVSEHLMQLGMDKGEALLLSQVIKEEVEGFEPEEGKEKLKEVHILKKVLARVTLEEDMAAGVCQVARNAYRDYWYRKKVMERSLNVAPDEPWEIAAQRTLELYKRTKPSFNELTRATQKIQAAYRGYYVRRHMMRPLKSQKQRKPMVELPGPPADVAGSREINLGPVITVNVREEDTAKEFKEVRDPSLHLGYSLMKTVTHVETAPELLNEKSSQVAPATKSVTGPAANVTGPTMSVAGYGNAKPAFKKSALKGIDDLEPKLDESFPNMLIREPIDREESRFLAEQSKSSVGGGGVHSKISFAEETYKKIIDDDLKPSSKINVSKEQNLPADADIPEELPSSDADHEDAQEVPENITDTPEFYDSAAETDSSAPLPSAPSSAAATDVDTATEDEGE